MWSALPHATHKLAAGIHELDVGQLNGHGVARRHVGRHERRVGAVPTDGESDDADSCVFARTSTQPYHNHASVAVRERSDAVRDRAGGEPAATQDQSTTHKCKKSVPSSVSHPTAPHRRAPTSDDRIDTYVMTTVTIPLGSMAVQANGQERETRDWQCGELECAALPWDRVGNRHPQRHAASSVAPLPRWFARGGVCDVSELLQQPRHVLVRRADDVHVLRGLDGPRLFVADVPLRRAVDRLQPDDRRPTQPAGGVWQHGTVCCPSLCASPCGVVRPG